MRLIDRVIATGVHDVEDSDEDPERTCLAIAERWVTAFGGKQNRVDVAEVSRCFDGTALVRVRATVAHDSYERLVSVNCRSDQHVSRTTGRSALAPLPSLLQNPIEIGIVADRLVEMAKLDEAIAEFSRFYLERRQQEVRAAAGDERKRTKLQDEFTPRLEMSLVGLAGKVHRHITQRTFYNVDEAQYEDTITVTPSTGLVTDAPPLGRCEQTGKAVPQTCLARCAITGSLVLKHLLVQSELSKRHALPEFVLKCGLSGKRIIKDEAEISAVTGRSVASSLLKTSAVSGKRAEPSCFGVCAFTSAEVLLSELSVSGISGKQYRSDEQLKSSVSGVTGHGSEFLNCHITGQPVAAKEAEQCALTGHYVRPGLLEECAVTHKRVLPSELSRCSVTGQRALRGLLVESSVSGARLLESVALRSQNGRYCAPAEARPCAWSGAKPHPEDLRTCALTGLRIHLQYVGTNGESGLEALVDLLRGINRSADRREMWDSIGERVAPLVGGRCRVEAAVLSPDQRCLAAAVEVKTLLGLRSRIAGMVYDLNDGSVIGEIAQGKRLTVNGRSTFQRK